MIHFGRCLTVTTNQLLASVSALETPLLRQIKNLGYLITAAVGVVGVLVFAYGRWVMGMDFVELFQAIEAPRWLMGRTWGTRTRNMSLEGRIPDEVARELKRRGQPVQMVTDWNDNLGHTHTRSASIANRAFWKAGRIRAGTVRQSATDRLLMPDMRPEGIS